MRIPEVNFVDVGDGRVAYQLFGAGDIDLLHVGLMWAIDLTWEHPGHLRVARMLGDMGRVIRLDPRGQGASDALELGAFGLESYLEDALAVLDDLRVGEVSVVGEAFGGAVALAMAARHPDRVRNVLLLDAIPRARVDDDYPAGMADEEVEQMVGFTRSVWGTGRAVAAAMPHLAGSGAEMLEFCGRFERAIAGPVHAADMLRSALDCDVRPLLAQVQAPVLVVHSGSITLVDRGHSDYLVEHLPAASLLTLHFDRFAAGDPNAVEIERFLVGEVRDAGDPELVTVVFTDVVGSTDYVVAAGDAGWQETLDDLDAFVAREASRHRGTLVKSTGDGHLVTFPSPAGAVEAARAITAGVRTMGISVRTGVHTGTIRRRADQDVTGLGVNIAARVADLAGSDEILVSRTVADLLAGTGIDLDDAGEHELKGVPDQWQLFSVRLDLPSA